MVKITKVDRDEEYHDLDWWRARDILPSGYDFYRENRKVDGVRQSYLCVGRQYDRFMSPYPDELHMLSVALQVIKNYEERNNVTD